MHAIFFKEYSSSTWVEWTERLMDMGSIQKTVESDEFGKAGVIAIDSVTVTFANLDYVKTAFDTLDADNLQNLIYQFQIKYFDNVVFDGVLDSSSVEFDEVNYTVCLDIVERLAAVSLVGLATNGRNKYAMTTKDSHNYTEIYWSDGNSSGRIKEMYYSSWTSSSVQSSLSAVYLNKGEILINPTNQVSHKGLTALITLSYLESVGGNNVNRIETPQFKNYEPDNVGSIHYYSTKWLTKDVYYYQKEYYDLDINIIENNELVAFDWTLIILAIVRQVWPDTTLYTNVSAADKKLSLDWYTTLIDNKPLDKEPLQAIKYLANTYNCYVFFDRNGVLNIITKDSFASNSVRTVDDGNASVVQEPKTRLFWDKIVDKFTVTVDSNYTWLADDTTVPGVVAGEKASWDYFINIYGDSSDPTTKQQTVVERNPKEFNVLFTDTKEYSTNLLLKSALYEFAKARASAIKNFYGKRHKAKTFNYIMPITQALSSPTATALSPIHWKPCDIIAFASSPNLKWFVEKMDIDLIENIASINLVSVDSWAYQYKSGIIPKLN